MTEVKYNRSPKNNYKSIGLLPGGIRNQVLTLTRILKEVDRANPTEAKLTSWLKRKYGISSEKHLLRCLWIVKNSLGLLETKADGSLEVTSTGKNFLMTINNKLLLDILRKRIRGFAEILSILSQGRGLNLAKIHNVLLKRYEVNWKKDHQVRFRLNWLMSLGYIDKEWSGERRYYLTEEGLKALKRQ